jgi:hypothetical protein
VEICVLLAVAVVLASAPPVAGAGANSQPRTYCCWGFEIQLLARTDGEFVAPSPPHFTDLRGSMIETWGWGRLGIAKLTVTPGAPPYYSFYSTVEAADADSIRRNNLESYNNHDQWEREKGCRSEHISSEDDHVDG